ncbi:MAG TPA: organomercurial lyase [Methylomirabilota bacterium]
MREGGVDRLATEARIVVRRVGRVKRGFAAFAALSRSCHREVYTACEHLVDTLDRTYHFILSWWAERGDAPHFTDVAGALAVTPEEGRQRLHEVIATGLPNLLFPGTDLIASFAPFHGLPTPYRVSVDGRSGWYAQCGFEAVAISFVFPRRTTIVDGSCLDCGDPLRITMRDGVIELEEPRGVVGYVDVPFREWRSNLPFA